MTTRDRLVRATADLLWERGYAGTSPAAIQQRAQAGQGSMYHHFAGKAELAHAAIESQATELREAFAAAVAPHDDAPAKLLAYLDLERLPLRGCRLGRQAQDADLIADETLRAVLDTYFTWVLDELARIVRDGQRDGQLSPSAEPRDLAALLVSSVQGAYVLARATGDAAHYRRCVDAAAGVVRALRVTHD